MTNEINAVAFSHVCVDAWKRRDVEAVRKLFQDDAAFSSPDLAVASNHRRKGFATSHIARLLEIADQGRKQPACNTKPAVRVL
jgi:hypothetical protein